jgi:NAD(P)-dependent dehydrogenase (short-subunit alcohol dehydrogenase family)
MRELRDKVAVVTGGASGIGRAMVDRFAAEGMKVVVADVEPAALAATERALTAAGHTVLAVATDVSKPGDVDALAERTLARFGKVHVLCNNAGVSVGGPMWEQTLDDWRWVLGVNLWGVIHGVRAFVPRMLAQDSEAHIVNTASMAGLATAPFMSVYDVTKFGVVALSESLYKDFLATGKKVRVSVLCPGLINTNIMTSSRNRPQDFKETGQFGAMAQQFRANLTAGLAGGYPPSYVADMVFEGIRDEKFYIIPSQIKDSIKRRVDQVLAEENPTLA